MLFITGPLYSGKRTFAQKLGGTCCFEVQKQAETTEDLEALAKILSEKYDIITATEVGGGVVPVDATERANREKAGPLGMPARRACRLCCADVLRHSDRLERGIAQMKIYLLRHGETAYNVDHRYQGVTDIPLSPAGLAALKQADFSPKTVYVTPLKRTKQTAEILFPTAEYIPVNDLSEMNFGVFEGRNYKEMEHDSAYRAWVDSNCESTCPGGECKADFSERVCKVFESLLNQSIQNSEDMLVIVAHGGTQMAVMEKYAVPQKTYYEWCAPTAGGYVLDARDWQEKHVLHLIGTVQYTKEATC